MHRPSEQILMAYADGALSPDEASEVAAFAKTDPQARAFVELMSRTTRVARFAIAEPRAGNIPPALVDLVLHGTPPPAVQASPVVRPAWRAAVRSVAASRYTAYAMAASIALVCAGVVVRGQWQTPGLLVRGPVAEDSRLAELLEQQPSGALTSLDEAPDPSLRGVVVTTFLDGTKRPCREIELFQRGEATPSAAAIGCRTTSGHWEVAGVADLTHAKQHSSGGSAYEPSGGMDNDPLGKLIAAIGATNALSAQEEADFLARKWRVSPD